MNDDNLAGERSGRELYRPALPGIGLAAIVVAPLQACYFQPMTQFDESLSCCHSTW